MKAIKDILSEMQDSYVVEDYVGDCGIWVADHDDLEEAIRKCVPLETEADRESLEEDDPELLAYIEEHIDDDLIDADATGIRIWKIPFDWAVGEDVRGTNTDAIFSYTESFEANHRHV